MKTAEKKLRESIPSGKEVTPFHSTTQKIYHVFRDCPEARNLDPYFVRFGKGENRTLCEKCAEMRKNNL